jgi:CHAT domain-containing protein
VAIESELADIARAHGSLVRVTPDELVHGLEQRTLRGSLLHIAAHGQYRHKLPAFSGLALGERFLLAHDIVRLGVPFDLVVLSGCETGRRRRIPGEEFRGLTRALHVGGAHASIGSLWAVEDEATAEYMTNLHVNLAAGMGLRSAVTRTQRTLLGLGRPATAWAAFTTFGDPGLRLPKASPILSNCLPCK